MLKVFEKMFDEVYNENNCNGWWEVFDSELFDEVCRRIVNYFGWVDEDEDEDDFDVCSRNSDEFNEWCHEMAEEL